MSENKTTIIDEEEFDAAEKEANMAVDLYVHKFSRPVEYNGRFISELSFDFDKLTGADDFAIEAELARLGKIVIAPQLSVEYLVRMAARACTEKIGADFFSLTPLKDFTAIKGKARSFLMRSEL